MTKSKKFTGVYFNELKNGDRSYYITYKDIISAKKIFTKIGKKSEGITEQYCYKKRAEVLNNLRLGESPEIIKNRRVAKNITSFDMIVQKYLENRKLHLKDKQVHLISMQYNLHIKDLLGDMDIESIGVKDIEKLKTLKIDTLSKRSINMLIEKVTTIYNFAIKHGYFKESNPGVSVEKFRLDNIRERYLTVNEVKELLDKVRSNNVLYIFTFLSLCTGARLKTVCNIKKKDINFDTGKIQLYDFKNNKSYVGFLKRDMEFISFFQEYLKEFTDDDFVVIRNARYIQRYLSKELDELFNKKIIKSIKEAESNPAINIVKFKEETRKEKVVVHTLRHTFASLLAINSVPIYTIKKLMNHSDIKMTLRYAKLAPDSGQDFINDIF